jgi:hypothetical protein
MPAILRMGFERFLTTIFPLLNQRIAMVWTGPNDTMWRMLAKNTANRRQILHVL